jgi:site-specific DNA-cytosine methylase
MVAIRKDIVSIFLKKIKPFDQKWGSTAKQLQRSMSHFKTFSGNYKKSMDFRWLEPNTDRKMDLFSDINDWPLGLLPLSKGPIFTIENVISNLCSNESKDDDKYLKLLNKELVYTGMPRKRKSFSKDEQLNLEHRNHTIIVRARFRILRLLSILHDRALGNEYLQKLKDTDIEYLKNCDLYFTTDIQLKKGPHKTSEIKKLIKTVICKKHSQRPLIKNKVAPAQLCCPDDLIHYQEDRTLSVREVARIQSFPDWFEFKSKVTTGSSRRAFEVPRYTQVGNAVPPLMAKKIGLGISDFLDIINKS